MKIGKKNVSTGSVVFYLSFITLIFALAFIAIFPSPTPTKNAPEKISELRRAETLALTPSQMESRGNFELWKETTPQLETTAPEMVATKIK